MQPNLDGQNYWVPRYQATQPAVLLKENLFFETFVFLAPLLYGWALLVYLPFFINLENS